MTWDTQPDPIEGTLASATENLTNKTINLNANTLTGTLAEFNTALSDANFTSLTGSETLTNKTLTSPTVTTPTISSPVLSGSATGTYTLAGTPTLTSPTINSPTIATPTITGLITASGGQIAFPATQSASADANTLDDYEEGTWTPAVGGTATYTTQTGVYTKIGRVVYIYCSLTINAIGTGSATTISGLPFTAVGNGTGPVMWASTAVNPVTLFAQTSSATVLLRGATAASANASTLSVLGNGASVLFSLFFTV